jgi:integrase
LAFALPKGEKTREVPVPDYLLKRIAESLERRPARPVTLPWKDPRPPKTERERDDRAPQTHALVLTAARGGAIRRDGFDHHVWKPALARAGVTPEPVETKQPILHRPGTFRRVLTYEESRVDGFHALRHTFASVQLDAREPIVAVSKWLGHADPSITLRIHAHMMPEADGRAGPRCRTGSRRRRSGSPQILPRGSGSRRLKGPPCTREGPLSTSQRTPTLASARL